MQCMANHDWFGDFMAGCCVCIREKHEAHFVLFMWITGSTNIPEGCYRDRDRTSKDKAALPPSAQNHGTELTAPASVTTLTLPAINIHQPKAENSLVHKYKDLQVIL